VPSANAGSHNRSATAGPCAVPLRQNCPFPQKVAAAGFGRHVRHVRPMMPDGTLVAWAAGTTLRCSPRPSMSLAADPAAADNRGCQSDHVALWAAADAALKKLGPCGCLKNKSGWVPALIAPTAQYVPDIWVHDADVARACNCRSPPRLVDNSPSSHTAPQRVRGNTVLMPEGFRLRPDSGRGVVISQDLRLKSAPSPSLF